MGLLYRFPAKYVANPTRLFAPNVAEKLGLEVGPRQEHTGISDIASLYRAMNDKKGPISTRLGELRANMLGGTLGTSLIASDALNASVGPVRKAFIKTVIVPQMKLFSHCNYVLSVNEERVIGSQYRLVLRLGTLYSSQVLAASDDARKGNVKLAIRAGAIADA
jgi:hypothetical protein